MSSSSYSASTGRRLAAGLVAAATAFSAGALAAAPAGAATPHRADARQLAQARLRAHRMTPPRARALAPADARPAAAAAVTPGADDPFSVTADAATLTWHDLTTGTSGTFATATAAFSAVADPVISADGSEVVFDYVNPGPSSSVVEGLAVFATQGTAAATVLTTVTTSSAGVGMDDDEATFTPDGSSVYFARYTDDADDNETVDLDSVPTDGGSVTTELSDADSPTFDNAGDLDFTPESVSDDPDAPDPTDDTPLVQQIPTGSTVSAANASTVLTYGQARTVAPGSLQSDDDVFTPTLQASRFDSTVSAAFFYLNDAGTKTYTEVGTIDPDPDASTVLQLLSGSLETTTLPAGDSDSLVVLNEGETDLDSTGTEVVFASEKLDLTTGEGTASASHTVDVPSGKHLTTLFSPVDGGITSYLPDSPQPVPSAYVPLTTPFRVLDTRHGTGAAQAPIGAGGHIDVAITGSSSPVPTGATAVVLNLTGIARTAATYLQAYPTPTTGSAAPLVSNLNLGRGQTVANAVTVALPASGEIRIGNSLGSTDALADITGYYTSDLSADEASGFTPLATPTRVLDTRHGTGGVRQAPLGAGGYVDVSIAGGSVVPKDATSVVLSVGGIQHSAASFVTAYPTPATSGNTQPTTSTVNLTGVTRSNLATVTVGADGSVRFFNSAGSTDVYADVVGYYEPEAGDMFHPLDPTRIYDSRHGTETINGAVAPIGAAKTTEALTDGRITTASATSVVPFDASAVQVNATVLGDPSTTFVSVFATPSGGGASSTPAFSSVNAPGNQVTATSVITAIGYENQSRLYNAVGSANVVLDLAGYFEPDEG